MKVELPIKTVSEANTREHWAVKAKRKHAQRYIVRAHLLCHKLPKLPAVVRLTRIGKRKLDGDNLQSAFKAIRDEVAKEYGVDDGSDAYTWEYAQEIGKQYGIRIEIEGVA